MRRLRVLAAVVSTALGLIPVAPADHLHQVEADGHRATLVHRHAESHHAHGGGPDHTRATLDDDDSVVTTIAAVSAVTSTYAPPAWSPSVLAILPTPGERCPIFPVFVEYLIHGPPRAPASLRAPPSPAFL